MSLLDLIFPKCCLGCGRSGVYFCPACTAKIRVVFQVCPVCERSSPFGETHFNCQGRYTLSGLTSFFAYEGIIRKAIHQLKYRLVTDLKDELSQKVKEKLEKKGGEFILLDRFLTKEKPVVVPIPLYWYKENYRGFNQAELIGKIFSDRFNLPLSNKVITRKRSTLSQTKLNPKERQKNVQEAFSVAEVPPPANILLVDDVWTTGATLKTAGNLLKKAGAKKVWGITIAR